MSNVLEQIKVSMTVEELKEKIRVYYLSLDSSITEVNVEHAFEHISGEWSEAWQRHLGGSTVSKVKVEIIRKVTAFGKEEIIKNYEHLKHDDLISIFKSLSKEEEYKPYLIVNYPWEEKSIIILCKKSNNENTSKISLKKYAEKALIKVIKKFF